jgi:hypothetical protein
MSVILANKEDYQKVINEEKEEWIYQVLIGLGVNEELLINSTNEEIISHLTSLGIEILDFLDIENIKIMRENKIVAEWKYPKLILKKENSKLYYEIYINEWALPFQMKNRSK